MCGSAGWWQLEMLLAQIAQQAELRSQPELMRLMRVGGGGAGWPGSLIFVELVMPGVEAHTQCTNAYVHTHTHIPSCLHT